MSRMIITTSQTIEGYAITQYQDIVFGEVISGANFLRDFGAGVRNVLGGRAKGYEKDLMRAREEAIDEMTQRAERIGADAIIGVDVDYQVLGEANDMLMVTCSGTAVQLTKRG